MKKRGRPPLFERLKAGLQEAIEFEEGKRDLKVTVVSIPDPPPRYGADDVLRIRTALLHQSQASFALFLNVSIKTVQAWEQGVRVPSQAAARLLQFVEKPAMLMEATQLKRARARQLAKT